MTATRSRIVLRDCQGRPRVTRELLERLIDELQSERLARVVTLEGSVGVFCEGLDLDALARPAVDGGPDSAATTLARYSDLLTAVERLPQPVLELARDRVDGLFLDPRGVARACLALCSGLMDAVTGQVLVVDEGWSLVSPLAYLSGRGTPGAFPDAADGTS